MKRLSVILILVLLTQSLFAERYQTLRSGLEDLLSGYPQMYRINHSLTREEAAYINENWGDPMLGGEFFRGDRIKIYYAVDANEEVTRIVVEINEVLQKYTAFHHWLIAFNPDGSLYNVVMLELTNDHTYPMSYQRYLRQFPDILPTGDAAFSEVDTVTGATESSYLLHASIQKAYYLADAEGLFR